MESSSQRLPGQFSLRELLISTAVIAVLLALYVINRPYSPSAFMTSLDAQAVLAQVCADLDIPLEFGGTSVMSGGGEQESSLMVNTPDKNKFQTIVMRKFRTRIESLLQDANGSINGRSQRGTHDFQGRSREGTNDFEALQQFGFHYRIGNTRGKVRVYCFEYPNDQLRLLIIVDEW